MTLKKFFVATIAIVICSIGASAQLNIARLIQGGQKAVQAIKLSDDEIIAYVHDYIVKTDSASEVCGPNDPYTIRLNRLTAGLDSVEGIPLNFKAYKMNEVNAFACADGSVRVYSGLMDIMSDNEVLGVIGHEMGHVAHKDTKNSFKQALLNAALRDGIAGASSKVGALTDSQLGDIGASLASSKYSRKEETNADKYGYEFLKSHGKNPAAMVLAFQKLQQLEQASGQKSSAINQLFSSHPDISKRIKTMTKMAQKDGYMDANSKIIQEADPEYIAAKALEAEKAKKAKSTKKTTKTKKSTKTTKK